MRRRWIVDTSNVMGSRPDGWWRDRDGALRRLVDELSRWRAEAGEPVLAVADGHPSAQVPEGTIGGVHVRFAHSRDRDAADDEIARIVARHPDPASLTIVTSDHALRTRVEAAGAHTMGAGRFLDTMDGTGPRRRDHAVLAHFGIDESALLGGGGEARVFAVDEDRVVRIPHGGCDATTLDQRRRFLDSLRGAAAPFAVPEVLEHIEIDGHLVVVERRLPGTNALEALADRATDREALVRSHLDAALAIATLPCPGDGFGERWGGSAIAADSFAEWAVDRLDASLRGADDGFAHVDPVALTEDLVDALPDHAEPRLVHLDAFLGNMLAEGDRITAVLDFGPMAIGGPPLLDPAVCVAYLAPEITPTAVDADRAAARRWADDQGITALLEPAERWVAAYWTGAPDDDLLQRWCRRILGAP